MRLSDLIKQPLTDANNPTISGVSHDTRKMQKGDVFVAISGTDTDGNAYIDQAISKGARAIISDKKTPKKSVPIIKVADSRVALAEMADALYPHKANLIAAITGTNGKTSIAEFLRQIWQRVGWKAASIGTLGACYDNSQIPIDLTTPDVLTLHKTLNELNQHHISHVIMEASSHGIEQHRLSHLPIAVAGFTNLTQDHLDHHKTLAHYFAAKCRLFTDILMDGGAAVINIDSTYGKDIVKKIAKRPVRIIKVGRDKSADFFIESSATLAWGQLATIKVAGKQYQVPLALLGDFQTDNAIMAAAMAHASGLDIANALLSLSYITAAHGRMHSINIPNSTARVVIDYAHTPDALDNALLTLKHLTAGRLGVVFGCGGDRDQGKRAEMGKIATTHADKIFITDDNPRNENPDTIRAEILTTCPQAENIGNRAQAIHHGVKWLKNGDTLLIAGKGHEDRQIVGDETLPFSDEGVVRAILQNEDVLPTMLPTGGEMRP